MRNRRELPPRKMGIRAREPCSCGTGCKGREVALYHKVICVIDRDKSFVRTTRAAATPESLQQVGLVSGAGGLTDDSLMRRLRKLILA